MTAAGRRLGIVIAGVLGTAAIAFAIASHSPRALPDRAPADRPPLLLLSSLPLVFSEQFSLDASSSPALDALQKRYRVHPISTTSAAELGKARLLLIAHPLAQPPEDLVALDRWVRSGGRLLLLADPMLEWPSERPLGDRLRPPPMFMDTGLLRHWGLTLVAPAQRGPKGVRLGDYDVRAVSPGSLEGECRIGADRFAAYCTLGKGRVTVVADADFIGVQHLDRSARRNLDALLSELAELETESGG